MLCPQSLCSYVLVCVFQSEKIKLTSIVTKFVSSGDFSQPSLEGHWDAFILSSFSFSLQASASILRAENRSKTSGQKDLKFQCYHLHEQPWFGPKKKQAWLETLGKTCAQPYDTVNYIPHTDKRWNIQCPDSINLQDFFKIMLPQVEYCKVFIRQTK